MGHRPQHARKTSPQQVETISASMQSLGAAIDLAEILFIWHPGVSRVAGVVDLIPAALSCYFGGECYMGQPHEDLPEMLVLNQDVLITLIDGLMIPGPSGKISMPYNGTKYVINEYDYLATTVSMVSDFMDIPGLVPNKISLGFNYSEENGVGIYFLYYPEMIRE